MGRWGCCHIYKKSSTGAFPGVLVAKTPHFHRGVGWTPDQGNSVAKKIVFQALVNQVYESMKFWLCIGSCGGADVSELPRRTLSCWPPH